jgi:diguanylate cyclase (GGDEF)-like protein
MTLAIAGLLGGLAFNAFWHYDKVENRFYNEVTFMRQHVRELMAQNESILSGFSAFLVGSRVADINATKTYAQRMLTRYPHILMFEVAQRVDQDNLEPFTTYLKEQNINPPKIWSFNYEQGIIEHDLKTDGEAFPVIFIEPESENSQLGLDISSIEFVHSVVKRFGKSDQLLMTEPFELLDGEIAIVMMQGVSVSESETPSYVSLLVIRAEQLIPTILKDKGWGFSLSSKDSNGHQFDLLRKDAKESADNWLPELKSIDTIRLTDFELTLEIKQQLGLQDFDWLHILGITVLMIVFPAFVLIMYRIHQGIEQQNSLKRQQLYQLANFDVLTGLANRFHFEDFGLRILSTAERNNTHVALFFIDLNGFKLVNDNLGHDIGDIVLQRVAETLTANVRQGDVVARIGGDEFVILADQMTTLHGLMSMLNNIREAISEVNIVETKEYKVSASVGFSYTEYHGYKLSELVKMADNSMYGEKQDHHKNN